MRSFRIITLLLLFMFFSCKEQKREYPEIIVKYNLEEKYDLAKWELYKLNCVVEDEEFDSDWIVHFASDKQDREYRKVQKEYKKDGKELEEDRLKLEEIFGKENIIDFVECKLNFPDEIDSLRIFEEGKIQLSFFPAFDGKKYFNFKLGGRLYNTIYFEQDKITACETGRFILPYEESEQKRLEEKFIQIIKNPNKKIHPWITKYYQNHKK